MASFKDVAAASREATEALRLQIETYDDLEAREASFGATSAGTRTAGLGGGGGSGSGFSPLDSDAIQETRFLTRRLEQLLLDQLRASLSGAALARQRLELG